MSHRERQTRLRRLVYKAQRDPVIGTTSYSP